MRVQCSINFVNGVLEVRGDAFAVGTFQVVTSMRQQTARFAQLLVGFPLVFAFGKIAMDVDAHLVTGFFKLTHCGDAMAGVVVIGGLQQPVGVNDFLTR